MSDTLLISTRKGRFTVSRKAGQWEITGTDFLGDNVSISTGGFQYVLEALQGQPPSDVAAALRGLLVAANGQPEVAGVFSTYAADTPQIYLDIDRDKAQVLGVKKLSPLALLAKAL